MISTLTICQRPCRKLGWRALLPADIRWEFVQAHKADAAMINFVMAQNFLAESGFQAAGFGLETLNLNGKLDALMVRHLLFRIS